MSKKEDNKLQTEFNITDENYDMYNNLLGIKSNKYVYSTIKSLGISTALGALAFLITLASTAYIVSINLEFALASVVICGCIDASLVLPISSLCLKLNNKIALNDFKKKYPNVNTFVDVEVLEKELTKYKELKTLPNNIKEKKEQYITNHKDEFREKTIDEKINELKKEIEFWEQVKLEEKYKKDNIEEKPKIYKKYNSNR